MCVFVFVFVRAVRLWLGSGMVVGLIGRRFVGRVGRRFVRGVVLGRVLRRAAMKHYDEGEPQARSDAKHAS
jgi:hypothetical protein